MKLRELFLVVLLGAAHSLACAQNAGIVYPTKQGSLATPPVQPASGAVRASQAASASAQAATAADHPASAAAKPAAPASSMAAASAPAAGAAPSPKPAGVVVSTPTGKGATAPSSKDAISGVTTVSTRKDGTRVIRSQVTPTMAEAEAALAATMAMPAVSTGVAIGGGAAPVASGSASILNDVKPLPKWVTQSLDRTQGQTRLVVAQGVTEIVKIARNFPNRFVTPFESAEVVTTDETITHDGVGGSVIVATSSDKPIGIFIQDRNSDRAIPLVLIPEDIPQRELRLVLDEGWGPPVLRNAPDAGSAGAIPSAQSDYVDYIKSVMRSMAKGDIPDGHALSPLQPELVPACQIPGLNVKLGQMLEGSKDRVVVYVVSNETRSTLPVQESGCYRTGVLAAAAFPRPVLEPGQSTELYVLLRKDGADARTSSKRRPTLVN